MLSRVLSRMLSRMLLRMLCSGYCRGCCRVDFIKLKSSNWNHRTKCETDANVSRALYQTVRKEWKPFIKKECVRRTKESANLKSSLLLTDAHCEWFTDARWTMLTSNSMLTFAHLWVRSSSVRISHLKALIPNRNSQLENLKLIIHRA